MLVAALICSDPACAVEAQARAETVAELEALACDCGCALQVLGWPNEEPDDDAKRTPALELVLLAA